MFELEERIYKYYSPEKFPCVYCDTTRWVHYLDGFSCESCGCTTTGPSIVFNGIMKISFVCQKIKFHQIPTPKAMFVNKKGGQLTAPEIQGSPFVQTPYIIDQGIAMAWDTEFGGGKIEKPFMKEDYPDLTGSEFSELMLVETKLAAYNDAISRGIIQEGV